MMANIETNVLISVIFETLTYFLFKAFMPLCLRVFNFLFKIHNIGTFSMLQLFVSSCVWSHYFTMGLWIGTPTVVIPQLRKEANTTTVVSDEMESWLCKYIITNKNCLSNKAFSDFKCSNCSGTISTTCWNFAIKISFYKCYSRYLANVKHDTYKFFRFIISINIIYIIMI